MKRMICFALTFLMLCAQITPVFAEGEQQQADVYARTERSSDDVYPSDIEDDTAEVITDDDITILVADIPEGAARLMVVPVPKTEREAWSWISDCMENTGIPIHTFDIYFEDAAGNRINADGAVVTIDCPHCSGTPQVCSLTPEGVVRVLNDSAHGATVTFTTDGSTYYVIVDKAPADHPGDTPQTGDNSSIFLWTGILVLSLTVLFLLGFWKGRKNLLRYG